MSAPVQFSHYSTNEACSWALVHSNKHLHKLPGIPYTAKLLIHGSFTNLNYISRHISSQRPLALGYPLVSQTRPDFFFDLGAIKIAYLLTFRRLGHKNDDEYNFCSVCFYLCVHFYCYIHARYAHAQINTSYLLTYFSGIEVRRLTYVWSSGRRRRCSCRSWQPGDAANDRAGSSTTRRRRSRPAPPTTTDRRSTAPRRHGAARSAATPSRPGDVAGACCCRAPSPSAASTAWTWRSAATTTTSRRRRGAGFDDVWTWSAATCFRSCIRGSGSTAVGRTTRATDARKWRPSDSRRPSGTAPRRWRRRRKCRRRRRRRRRRRPRRCSTVVVCTGGRRAVTGRSSTDNKSRRHGACCVAPARAPRRGRR